MSSGFAPFALSIGGKLLRKQFLRGARRAFEINELITGKLQGPFDARKFSAVWAA
jgi:hypothetical protein